MLCLQCSCTQLRDSQFASMPLKPRKQTILMKITWLKIPTGGGRPVGYLQSVQDLNSGPPKTNPSSGREENLNPGPPAYKSSALTTRPRSPPNLFVVSRSVSKLCCRPRRLLSHINIPKNSFLNLINEGKVSRHTDTANAIS